MKSGYSFTWITGS